MAKTRKRIPCLIHIPCSYPNGDPIEPEKIARFFDYLDRQFGGSSELGTIPGHWLGLTELMLRVEVAVDRNAIREFEEVAKRIGRETKQKEMYVVIDYRAEVRFLPIDQEGEEAGGSTSAGGRV